MNVLIVLAHPNPSSFNHALAARMAEAAREAGQTVRVRDLYAERFDPVLPAAELEKDAVLDAEIEAACREVEEADVIGIVHPNWWSAPPAILRGWVDRCLRAGRAYRFEPDGKGGARAVGLLKARAVVVINTGNTPPEIEERVLGDPLDGHWPKVVFGLGGLAGKVARRNFAPVSGSTPAQRAAWLDEAASLMRAAVESGTRMMDDG